MLNVANQYKTMVDPVIPKGRGGGELLLRQAGLSTFSRINSRAPSRDVSPRNITQF